MARYLIVITLFLTGLLPLRPAYSQQPSSKGKAPDDQPAIRQEIDQLKEGQKQILRELQELRKLLEQREAGLAPTDRGADQPPRELKLSVFGETFKGDKDARLAIIEYSDFQCPYCGSYARETFGEIDRNYIKTGKIKYFFRDLPLPIHPNALPAARAARCAGEQGKFWEMHDRLFAHQNALAARELPGHAAAIGLELSKFNECLAGSRYADAIRKSMTGAERMGISGTPAFLIGTLGPNDNLMSISKVIMGAEPYESFKTALDELLSSPAR